MLIPKRNKLIRETKILSGKALYHINASRLDYYEHCAFNKRNLGTDNTTREKSITISLTTYGSRINYVHLTIESLLQQTTRPNNIILWLDENEFSESNIPTFLMYQRERGLTIRYYTNIKSYKKIIPTLLYYPNDIIITVDDDIIFPHTHIECLYQAYLSEPHLIHCYRGHKIKLTRLGSIRPYSKWEYESKDQTPSTKIFPTNGAGTLFTSDMLHNDVTNKELFMNLCPTGDDIWLKAMSLKLDIKCKLIGHRTALSHYIHIPATDGSLFDVNKFKNDEQIKKVFDFYPELKNKIND